MDAELETRADALPSSPAPARWLELELTLAPGDARHLTSLLHRHGPRAAKVRLTWHDTPDFALAADGFAVVERRQGRAAVWRLEQLAAVAGAPCPVLAEAATAAALGVALPASLGPVASFDGRARVFDRLTGAAVDGAAVEVTLLAGTLGTLAATRPGSRVLLAGPGPAVTALAGMLAERLRLYVPETNLAAEALAVAGRPPSPHRRAAPALPPGQPVGEAFAWLVARLTEAILHEAPHAGPADAEPVHQMRVAVRRLRSAIGLFGRAVSCPELAACKGELRMLAKVLGPARDWDVFVAGTGCAVAAAFAEDDAVRRLLEAAERRRQSAYVALHHHLHGAAFRRLGITLAVLATARPWEAVLEATGDDMDGQAARQAERLAGPLTGFAARALERRLQPLRAPGADIDALPVAALHGLRLHGKRLRYACEFFAPLFPGRGARRFIRRLAVLQERLGHLNDGAVAAGLMAELPVARGYAGGVVRGFVTARAAGTRARIGRSWRRFHRLDPFWE